jgi:hypothetical protein
MALNVITMLTSEDIASKYKSDPRSTSELLALVSAKDVDADNEEYWQPIRVLQHRLPSEFEVIRTLSRTATAKEQDDAATILGQNSVKHKFDVERCQSALEEMLSRPNINSPPLASILFALGHLKAPGYVHLLLQFQTHSDARVRYAVATSLGQCREESAIKALIELSRDSDFEVRNWATFGLGSLSDADSESLRQALVDRLTESDDEIRGEALVGLVVRHDIRAIDLLCREISDWRRQPLINDCAEKLIEDRKRFSEKWDPVYEQLERAGFRPSK